ncbi:MAG: OmpA family protein [Polyangiaceae bacterium]
MHRLRPLRELRLACAGLAAALALIAIACGPPPLPPENAKRVTAEDSDGDGIKNDIDRCPDVPEDEDGIMDGDGCPEKDADGDGAPDVCDKCPLERGPNSADHPYGRGCPVVVDTGSFYYLKRFPITFEKNDAKLTAKEVSQLGFAATKMREEPENVRFVIVGNAADDERTPNELALQRAQAVKDALAAVGVEPERLEVHAADTAHPIFHPGGQEVDKVATRRVEIEPSVIAARPREWDPKKKSVEYVKPVDVSCDEPAPGAAKPK